MKSNRLSAFFCLLGLAALVPAYFLPALLVTNSVEGSWWYSIWDGIVEFYEAGDYFLAILIFVFSVIFPVAKLLLTLACCISSRIFGRRVTASIVAVTGWTAKYSMIDVLVMAMLIVLVKVDEFVKFIPTVGLYLFTAAIVASVLAHWTFEPPAPRPKRYGGRKSARTAIGTGLAILLTAGGCFGAWFGWTMIRDERGGAVERIRVTSLNERVIPRSVDRLKTLSDAYGENEGWLPDPKLLARAADMLQALVSDTGVYEPLLQLEIETTDGVILTEEIEMGLEKKSFETAWALEEPLILADISAITMNSRVKYNRWMSTSLEEEALTTASDPFRSMTHRWYGKVFQFDLIGPPRHAWVIGWCVLIVSLLVAFACVACLLVAPSKRKAITAD